MIKMQDNIRYLILLNKDLKRDLENEATELQLSLAAYIRLILMNRGKIMMGVANSDTNNEVQE